MNHRTFSPACQIADRAIVWALFRNGAPVLQDGAPSTLSAVEIAGHYHRKYGTPLKPLQA
jgi:hypothetical protein